MLMFQNQQHECHLIFLNLLHQKTDNTIRGFIAWYQFLILAAILDVILIF